MVRKSWSWVVALPAVVLLAGCGQSSADTVQGVADQIGCVNVRTNHNAMDYPEVDCKLDGKTVTITDWSKATKDQRDALLSFSIGMGYQVIGIGEHITAGSESMRAAKKIQKLTDGSWLSAS